MIPISILKWSKMQQTLNFVAFKLRINRLYSILHHFLKPVLSAPSSIDFLCFFVCTFLRFVYFRISHLLFKVNFFLFGNPPMGHQTVLALDSSEIHGLIQPYCRRVVCFHQQHHALGLITFQRFCQQLSPVASSAVFRQDVNSVWLVLFKAMRHVQIPDDVALVYGKKSPEFLRRGGYLFAGPIHVFFVNCAVFCEILFGKHMYSICPALVYWAWGQKKVGLSENWWRIPGSLHSFSDLEPRLFPSCPFLCSHYTESLQKSKRKPQFHQSSEIDTKKHEKS